MIRSKELSVILALITCFFFIAEVYVARVNHATSKVAKKLEGISADNLDKQFDKKFIYISTDKVLYSPLLDSEFNIGINGGYFKRNVEYCQWRETPASQANQYNYKKAWVEDQINSMDFHDNTYINPKVQIVKKAHITGAIKVGSYNISPELTNIGATTKLIPTMQQIGTFTVSSMQPVFRYIGKGYFYKEFQSGASPVFRQNFGYNTNGDLPDVPMKELFDDCNPGDVRVTFSYWAPSEVSLIGFRNGTTIQAATYKGVAVGTLSSGYVSAEELLQEKVTSAVGVAWTARILLVGFGLYVISTKKNASIIVSPLVLVLIYLFVHAPGVHKTFESIFVTIVSGIVTAFLAVFVFVTLDHDKKNQKKE